MNRRHLSLLLIVFAATAQADESPLCQVNHQLIERSLKEIARDQNAFVSEEIEAAIHGDRKPPVYRPVLVATAWSQIDSSLHHMQTLGCQPYPAALDPQEYWTAAFACNRAKGRDAQACKMSTWKRQPWKD